MRLELVIFLAVVVVAALAMLLLSNGGSGSNADRDVMIGYIAPLTGPASIYGEPATKAALMAQDEINEKGGIKGRMLRLIVEDGKCDGKEAVSAAHKLIDVDKVGEILGGHCSTESLAIAPVAEQSKVIQLASITSSPYLTEAGDYIFRNHPSSQLYISRAADYAFDKGYKRIAALYELKEFPQGAYDVFKKQLEIRGGTAVISGVFSTDDNDIRSQLTKINDIRPDAIFFVSQGSDKAILFLQQMKELRMLEKYPVVGGVTLVTKDAFLRSNGLLNSNMSATDGYSNPDDERTKQFLIGYQGLNNEIPPTVLFYVTSSYDAVYLIKDAISSCRDEYDTECIKEFLYNVKNWKGAAGTLTIDKSGDAITSIGLHYFESNGTEVWKELR